LGFDYLGAPKFSKKLLLGCFAGFGFLGFSFEG
jgi:hypothetical protein